MSSISKAKGCGYKSVDRKSPTVSQLPARTMATEGGYRGRCPLSCKSCGEVVEHASIGISSETVLDILENEGYYC